MTDPKEFKPGGLFYDRGITEEEAKDRYVPYACTNECDHEADECMAWDTVVAADPGYDELTGSLRSTVKRKVRVTPGYVIKKFAVPVPSRQLDAILAELRPNKAVFTKPKRAGAHRRMFDQAQKYKDDPKKYSRTAYARHVRRSKVTCKALLEGGAENFVKKLEERGWGDGSDHAGREPDVDWKHQHGEVGKYQFAGENRVPVADGPPHKHADYKTARGRQGHIRRKHLSRTRYGPHKRSKTGGQVQPRIPKGALRRLSEDLTATGGTFIVERGRIPTLHEKHQHHRMVKADDPLAMRMDIHKDSIDLLRDAQVVLLALEGSMKNDAALRYIRRNKLKWAVANVPSITLFRAGELEEFARTWMTGRLVLVCIDADWQRPNDDSVIRQAIRCRELIRSFKVARRVEVVAPHPEDGKGLDDALAAGARLEDLVWVQREVPRGYDDFLVERGLQHRSEARERNGLVLDWLALHAGPDGVSTVAETTIAGNLAHVLPYKARKPTPLGPEPVRGTKADLEQWKARKRKKDTAWLAYEHETDGKPLPKTRLGQEAKHRCEMLRLEAAKKRVQYAIEDLEREGALTSVELEHRRTYYVRKNNGQDPGEWVGVIEVAPELRAEIHTDRTVRDLLRFP
jgi:hypothetical protein